MVRRHPRWKKRARPTIVAGSMQRNQRTRPRMKVTGLVKESLDSVAGFLLLRHRQVRISVRTGDAIAGVRVRCLPGEGTAGLMPKRTRRSQIAGVAIQKIVTGGKKRRVHAQCVGRSRLVAATTAVFLVGDEFVKIRLLEDVRLPGLRQ